MTAVLFATLAWGEPSARADEQNAAAAEMMFRQGRALMVSGDVREACQKFDESKRLDPAPGTLLNLAQCYEALGRTASAWVNYGELAVLARKLGQSRRATFAREKIAALEPALPRIVVHVPPAHRVAGLAVEYDGTVLGPAAWETRVPVDAGAHRITASAPGRAPWVTTVEASAGNAAEVVIPLLDGLRDAEAVDHDAEASSSEPGAIGPRRAPSRSSPRTVRTLGIATAVTGGLAAGAGFVFGGVAKLENDRALRDDCSADGCSGAGLARIDRAGTFADVATVTIITGVALALAGVAIAWLARP